MHFVMFAVKSMKITLRYIIRNTQHIETDLHKFKRIVNDFEEDINEIVRKVRKSNRPDNRKKKSMKQKKRFQKTKIISIDTPITPIKAKYDKISE